MIVKIPDDIFNYQHKVWGNFTKRQLICGIIALVLIAVSFVWLLWKTNDPNLTTVVACLIGVPIFFEAKNDKDGQHFEKILYIRFFEKFRYKQKRKFIMSNLYEVLQAYQKECELYADYKKQEHEQQKEKQSHPANFFSLAKKRYHTK